MAKMMRCKACGYITNDAKIGEVCPACGLPRTVFEEYEEKISPRRKFIIDLHLHPIAVHFPQALATLIPLLIIAGWWILKPTLAIDVLNSARILAILLPFSVLGAIVAGLIDGKTRFKKLSTPLLVKKIVIGSILLLLSVGVCVLVLLPNLGQWAVYTVLALSLACVGCEILLGNIGSGLMSAFLRG
jgi:rubredoxin